ncbi:unnamed protein product, partial [Ectocarpus sp. 12 AP-2014]
MMQPGMVGAAAARGAGTEDMMSTSRNNSISELQDFDDDQRDLTGMDVAVAAAAAAAAAGAPPPPGGGGFGAAASMLMSGDEVDGGGGGGGYDAVELDEMYG